MESWEPIGGVPFASFYFLTSHRQSSVTTLSTTLGDKCQSTTNKSVKRRTVDQIAGLICRDAKATLSDGRHKCAFQLGRHVAMKSLKHHRKRW